MRVQLLLGFLLVCTMANAGTGLVITNAMIPAAPPTMTVRGAFMTLENPTAKDIRITKISSPQFDSAEIHQTILKNNVYKMVRQDVLLVPAKGKVELKHGGFHVMLFDPKAPLQAGDTVTIILTLQGGKRIPVEAKVMASDVDETQSPQQHQQ